MLSVAHTPQNANREILLTIISTIRYPSRQGIALRGKRKTDKSREINSHFN